MKFPSWSDFTEGVSKFERYIHDEKAKANGRIQGLKDDYPTLDEIFKIAVLSMNLTETIDQIPVSYGAIFYNWLPTEKDCLTLKTTEPDSVFTVWFEKLDSSIVSDKTASMYKLKGKLEISNVTSDLLNIYELNKTQYIPYEEFGKRVVKKMIYPTLSNLLSILRINYGQYWIAELQPWNSLEMTLGQYCRMFEMKWSIDGKEWQDFLPTRGVMASLNFKVASESFFEQYILKNDWQELAEFINKGYAPSVASTLLSRAHQYENQEDFRSSFIEGISALQFWDKGLKPKVFAITITLGTISIEDIENTMKAIDIRNKIAHAGWEPTDKARCEIILMGLFRTIAALLSGPKFKFPKID